MTRSRTTSRSSSIVTRPTASDLSRIIHERITRRLGSRVRQLSVAIDQGVIHLSGQCSTFYTKQLAQHAVLGVVEDEVIENAIEVTLPAKPK